MHPQSVNTWYFLRLLQEQMVRSCLMRRPVSVTMARIWAALSVWERARFIMSLLTCGSISAEDVEQLRVRPCPSLRHTLLSLEQEKVAPIQTDTCPNCVLTLDKGHPVHSVTCGTLCAWLSGGLADYAHVSSSEGGGAF